MFREYPYLNLTDLNLDYIYRQLVKMKGTLNEYVERSTITFHDPITWDITDQYTRNTMVIDTDGTAYLSIQPVPAGIDIANINYWQPIFNYDDAINYLRSQIAANFGESSTVTSSVSAGDLLFWKGALYAATVDMPAGTGIIVGTNVTPITVDDKINNAVSALETEIADVRTSIETLTNVYSTPEQFGAVGDGVTDDTAAINSAFEFNNVIMSPGAIYRITSPLVVNHNINIDGRGAVILADTAGQALTINADRISVNNLRVNCNARANIGLRTIAAVECVVNGCEFWNTDNDDNSKGCAGIYVDGDGIVITNCYIHDIHRTYTNPGNIASNGIGVKIRSSAIIENNRIVGVDSYSEKTDCDGIHTTRFSQGVTQNERAVIRNNYIAECTGRFIKIQNRIAEIVNNQCINTFSDQVFLKAFDLQYNIAAIVANNDMTLGAINSSSSICNIDASSVVKIYNNTFTADSPIRNAVNIGQVVDGMELEFSNNKVNIGCQRLLTLAQGLTGSKVKFLNNSFAGGYRLVYSNVATDLTGNFFVFEGNRFGTGNILFADGQYSFNSAIIRDNFGMQNRMNANYAFTRGYPSEFYYVNSTASTGVVQETNAYVKHLPNTDFMVIKNKAMTIL